MGSLIFFVAFLFGHMSGARNNGGARDERRVHFEDHPVKIAQVEHEKGDAHGKGGARSKYYKGKRRGRSRGKRGKGKGYKGYKGKRRGKGRGKRGKGKNKGCNPASGEDRGEDSARPKGGARSGAREHGGASDISGARPKGGARGGKRCGEVGGARDKGGARGRDGQDKDCAHVRQGDGEGHSGYRGKCDTSFLKSLKSLLDSRSIAIDKSLLDLMITVEMGSIGHRMNSQEQSKAVDEAIYEALHDYVEGQAPTNLFMAAEKNVKTFLKKYRKSLNNKTDQERGGLPSSSRRVRFNRDSLKAAKAWRQGGGRDQALPHSTPAKQPQLVEMAKIKGILRTGRTQQQESEEQHTGSIIESIAEEDPQSAFQGMAPPDADKLRAQEAIKMNAERQAAPRSREMEEMQARCLVKASDREVAKEVDDSPSPITAEEAEEGKRPLDSQTAVECWRACKEDSQNKSSSCGASKMELASGLNSEGQLEETADGTSSVNSGHQQKHVEELPKDAQDPAPGVQQNKILGSTDSSSNSAEVAVSNDDNDAMSREEASDLGALTEYPQQKEAYWKSHQEAQQRVECTPQGKQATAPQDGIANPSVKSDVRDQDRPNQVRQDQVPLDQEGQQRQPRMGGSVKRGESPSASSSPLAQKSIQDKYAEDATEPPAENIAAVKEIKQQVQSNLQDKPQQVKGLVDEAFRSSIVVYEQAAKPAAAAAAAEPAVAAKLAAARSIASANEAKELTAAAAKLAVAENIAGVYEAIQPESRDKFQRQVIQDKYAELGANIAKRQVQFDLKSPKSGSDQRVDSSSRSSNPLAPRMVHGINRKGKQRNVDPHITVFKQTGKNKHADFDQFGDNVRIGKHCEDVAVQQPSV